jgi:P-type Cu+ transporter
MVSKTIASKTIDPVCGMEVDPTDAVVVDYAGSKYHFCEAACADTFREDPERWVRPEGGRQSSTADS